MPILDHLEPQAVFSYFEQLCAIPHGSGNTKAISDFLVRFAAAHHLRCIQDAHNNVVIFSPGTPGYETAAPVILQGHMDMVCETAPDCTKDMTREGLDLFVDGDTIGARGTTLGGDDGIAVAMALAILDADDIPHPPLEIVITVDEETGMLGAAALDASVLKGRTMLNLDSEDEGVLTVSCAGGNVSVCTLPVTRAPFSGTALTVTVGGLLGGHSGAEIDKGRGNAVQLMGRALYGAMEQVGALRIADLRGGQFDNVICPRCDAVVAVPAGKEEEFTSFVRKFDRIMKNELSVADGGVTLSCAAVSGTAAYDADASARMLHALLVMPQGVQVMSPDFPGLVQTSQNLGVITAEDDGLRFSLSIRSSVASEKEMLLQKVRAIITFAGGTVSTRGDYPAWQYARQSPLRDTVMAAYKRVTGKDGVALAIHAGLECGLLAGKMPGLDAVSFGPELLDIHSPRERLGVASVERMYQLVCEILKNCR